MLIKSKFDLSHPRSMDTSKREKPPEVKNLLKIGSPEEDSKLVPNNYQDLFFKLMILIRHKCELKQQAHFDKFKNSTYMYRPIDLLAETFREFRPSWLNNSACNNAERAYYEKLSKCKVASSMTESSDPPTHRFDN